MTAVTVHIQVPRRTERTKQVGSGYQGRWVKGLKWEWMGGRDRRKGASCPAVEQGGCYWAEVLLLGREGSLRLSGIM